MVEATPAEAEVEGERGADEEEAEGGEGEELAAVDAEAFPTEEHDSGDDEPCQPEAVKKHRGGVHPLGV